MTDQTDAFRISEITLDERTIARRGPEIEHERQVAIFDLLEESYFRPKNSSGGPYGLALGIEENRLHIAISTQEEPQHGLVIMALSPFRGIVKDYFLVCESYYDAIKNASPAQIEAIDMGRRGLHNEGSELLIERLKGKIDLDLDTARRLFTLICVLQIKL